MKKQKNEKSEKVVIYNQVDNRNFARQSIKIGKLEAKEAKQVANEKTLSKNICTTRQKLVNLKKYEVEELENCICKHINFMSKKRSSVTCGFDATALKRLAKSGEVNLYEFLDERGLNCVRCLSYLVGVLDKQLKEKIRELERENKKLSK